MPGLVEYNIGYDASNHVMSGFTLHSPLGDASVCNDIHSLDIALSEVQLAAKRAFDIDLLVRRRAQILQGTNEEYEDIGGFADLIRDDEMDVDE